MSGNVQRIIAPDYPGAFLDWRVGSGRTIEIFDIHVPNEYRRMGVGRAMMSQLLASVPPEATVWAITRTENRMAQEWYTAMGFHVTAALYEFYDSGCGRVDALMFGRRASGAV